MTHFVVHLMDGSAPSRYQAGNRVGREVDFQGLVEGQTLDHVTHAGVCTCTHRHRHRNTHTLLGIAVLGNKILPEDFRKSFLGKKYVLKPKGRAGMSQTRMKRSLQQQQHAWSL